MTDDTPQPAKPAGERGEDGRTERVEDRQAVRNQGEAKPSDYPEGDRAAGDKVAE